MGRLVTLPTDGRRVPGTLVVSSGAAALTAVVLVTELSTTGLDQPGAAALLGLALVAAATGVYRVAARLDAPWPVRVVAALTVVLVSLGLPHMTVADAALLAGTCGAAAGLAHWARSRRRLSGGEIAVFAGLPTALAALAGPPGWAAVGVGVLVVVVVGLAGHRPARRIGVSVAGLTVLPALAVGGWTWRTGALPAAAGWPTFDLVMTVLGLLLLASVLVRRGAR